MAFIAGGFLLAAPVARAESNGDNENTTHSTGKRVKSAKRVVPRDQDDAAKAGDNTSVNKRDRSKNEATADQQKNDKSDVAVTAEIRRAIVKDKTLSTNAHNVKIIVQSGNVTLKGPVGSETERAAVAKAARDAMGANKGTLTDEMTVTP
jgi:osmotically-inducible protein OsmY